MNTPKPGFTPEEFFRLLSSKREKEKAIFVVQAPKGYIRTRILHCPVAFVYDCYNCDAETILINQGMQPIDATDLIHSADGLEERFRDDLLKACGIKA